MLVKGKYYRTIFEDKKSPEIIKVIDQRVLPHKFSVIKLREFDDFIYAIKDMIVRGAPLIGVTASYAMYIAALKFKKSKNFSQAMVNAATQLKSARPTAVNLNWAVDNQLNILKNYHTIEEQTQALLHNARRIAEDDVNMCKQIGLNGLKIIKRISQKKNHNTVNILTHCNAGWLATVDYGTALAPIYFANQNGIKIHVWVDETRPRNQGAKLTAWELSNQDISHTVITDNAGGHLMQHGFVDMVIVGSDRTTFTGDVANKIGTYLKALAAKDNKIPFYVALPSSTIDWKIDNGVTQIPIEQRNQDEVRYIDGLYKKKVVQVLIPPENSNAANYAFDVTPSRLVTALITEKGVCKANKESIIKLFSDNSNE